MVEKLNDMIKSRYGKGLSIRRLAGVGESLNQEVSLRGEDLYIPIFVKDIFLGYGLVHEARELSSDDHQHLARLVRMMLEPHLYSQHLERTIQNIEIEKSLIAEVEESEKSRSLFIFGSQAQLVQKVSLEIHELSGRMSYLPISAVLSGLNSLADLRTLDDSTLVVDLDSQLPEGVQDILADYIKSEVTGPLLLFIGSKSAAHLSVNQKLQAKLRDMEFCVDRLPLEKSALSEVLEMLFLKS